MINAIIFDFGDIFINLNKDICANEFKKLGLKSLNEALLAKNDLFEKGEISEREFIESFHAFIPNVSFESFENISVKFDFSKNVSILDHAQFKFPDFNRQGVHIWLNKFGNSWIVIFKTIPEGNLLYGIF